MKKVLIFTLAILVLMLSSCDLFGSKDEAEAPAEFASINIAGATGLVMQKSSSKGLVSELAEQALSKIVGNEVSEVPFLDVNGNENNGWGKANSIIRIDDDYIIVTFPKLTSYYPPCLLVETGNKGEIGAIGSVVCLNHIRVGEHENMDNLLSDKYISSPKGSNYIYYTTSHLADNSLAIGSTLKRYNKTTHKIEVLKETSDQQVYAIAVGKNGNNDVVFFYPVRNLVYGSANVNNYTGYILQEGQNEKTVSIGSSGPFLGFFSNDKFYITDNSGIKSVDLNGTVSSSYIYSKNILEACTEVVSTSNSSIIYSIKQEQGLGFIFLIKNGVVTDLSGNFEYLSKIVTDGTDYYVCGVSTIQGNPTTVKKYAPSANTFTDFASSTKYTVSSLYLNDDGNTFQFVGKKDSMFVLGTISSQGFNETEESTEEYNFLTKI